MSTAYHARYFAHELGRRACADDVARLSTSLFDATVDLNPHQIDAALFALKASAAKGVLLADEVGLGKTIEAGLVLCQSWAERRRRLLVVCPAALRRQWANELAEKFHLPVRIVDAPTRRLLAAEGQPDPFTPDAVAVLSLHYASAIAEELRALDWDLVVIDEAHKLRNSYRESNRIGRRLRVAFDPRRKLLLTATPLQNSLLELYGLVSFIDDTVFGDLPSFKSRYTRTDADLRDLRMRLEPFCKRTLRRQVTEYVRYTERRAMTKPFRATDEEQHLYDGVDALLAREESYALPARQRHLLTMVLRKLLASSSHALAGTLDTLRRRLEELREGLPADDLLAQILSADGLASDEEDEDDQEGGEPEPIVDRAKLESEIAELSRLAAEAHRISVDTKSRALLDALQVGFQELARMGAAAKAVVFTESVRTQRHLKDFLEANGWRGKVVAFNGTNRDDDSQRVYERWLARHEGEECVTGSRPIDVRTALVEQFRDEAQVLIATEAGAEGMNFQFCSLVINYDLPWNPQRIEQRIGRCHRYGQRHDVVVVNFVNERNQADQRVLELLTEKFHLFSGVFGASDEVLGSIESGVDFEKRILAIYQTCRTPEQIDQAFARLREEMDDTIRARMDDTRRALIEHFDEEVHERLRVQLDEAKEQLDRTGRLFWLVTRYVLGERARFDDEAHAFELIDSPLAEVPAGRYVLGSRGAPSPQDHPYRLTHPLGEWALETARGLKTPPAHLTFRLDEHPTRIAALEPLAGKSGWLTADLLTIDALDREELILLSGFVEGGSSLDQETCEKLFRVAAEVASASGPEGGDAKRLSGESEQHVKGSLARALEANDRLFRRERERLEVWADDRELAADKQIEDSKQRLKQLRREAREALSTDAQHAVQLRIREAEADQRRLRQQIFDVTDDIAHKRDGLIDALEKRMQQRSTRQTLFAIRWSVR